MSEQEAKGGPGERNKKHGGEACEKDDLLYQSCPNKTFRKEIPPISNTKKSTEYLLKSINIFLKVF